MTFGPFKREHLITVGEALDIAEDKTGNYYKFSAVQWNRQRYDVRTLSSLAPEQIVPDVFALLYKGVRAFDNFDLPRKNRDCYFICLQDHEILKALGRDRNIDLLPLLVYIFTHELVHIVRFSNFLQRFEGSERDREREENIVYDITHDILKNLSVPRMNHVLDSYRWYTTRDSAGGEITKEMR